MGRSFYDTLRPDMDSDSYSDECDTGASAPVFFLSADISTEGFVVSDVLSFIVRSFSERWKPRGSTPRVVDKKDFGSLSMGKKVACMVNDRYL